MHGKSSAGISSPAAPPVMTSFGSGPIDSGQERMNWFSAPSCAARIPFEIQAAVERPGAISAPDRSAGGFSYVSRPRDRSIVAGPG